MKNTYLSTIGLVLALPFNLFAQAESPYYYNGTNQQRITVDSSQVAEFPPLSDGKIASARSAQSASQTASNWRFVIFHPAASTGMSLPSAHTSVQGTSPVYREGDSPAGRLMALPGGVIVQFQSEWTDAQVASWITAKGLVVNQRLGIHGNWYLIRSASGAASLNLANSIYESGDVVSASPNWWKATVAR